MALSPLAALSLPLATSPEWQAGAAAFADRLRAALTSERASKAWANLDDKLTYMEWTWDAFGVDLSQVWDPDLWMRLKTAVRCGGAAVQAACERVWARSGLCCRCAAGACAGATPAATHTHMAPPLTPTQV